MALASGIALAGAPPSHNDDGFRWNEAKKACVDPSGKTGRNRDRPGPCGDRSHAKLKSAKFKGQDLRGAKFQAAELCGADFSDADLRGADLSAAGLRKANFSGAKLQGAIFLNADLRSAKFDHAELAGAMFTMAYLNGIDFSKAAFRDAKFDQADYDSTTTLFETQGEFDSRGMTYRDTKALNRALKDGICKER
jgi:uncharacterized protein YjbI with pentapeptide repeats